MYVYALSYANPYDPAHLCVLFLASRRPLDTAEAVARGVEAVSDDSLGHEWVEAVAAGTVCGPIEIDGKLAQPTIAIYVD